MISWHKKAIWKKPWRERLLKNEITPVYYLWCWKEMDRWLNWLHGQELAKAKVKCHLKPAKFHKITIERSAEICQSVPTFLLRNFFQILLT